MQLLAREVVVAKTEWVHTLGPRSEELHDRIDAASCEVGRQHAVGDGDPMTAWHDQPATLAEMIESGTRFRYGGSDHVLFLVVADESRYTDAAEELKRAVSARIQEN
jgi:hypothetical protein